MLEWRDVRRIAETLQLLSALKMRRNTWLGHPLRYEGHVRIIVEGSVEKGRYVNGDSD